MSRNSNFVVKAIIEIDVDGTDEDTVLADLDKWLQTKSDAGISVNATEINSIFVGELNVLCRNIIDDGE